MCLNLAYMLRKLPLHKMCHYFGRKRTLVAMAPNRLIFGKWKLTISAVSLEIFDFFFFLQICLLSSPPRFI